MAITLDGSNGVTTNNGKVEIRNSDYTNGILLNRNLDVATVGAAGIQMKYGAIYNGSDVYPVITQGVVGADGTALRWEVLQDGSSKLKVDSAGCVTTPYQPHIFGSPHNGSEASSGNATLFRVKTSRGLSFSNGRITVPVAGVYLITWQTIAQTNTGRYDTRIFVNGGYVSNGLNEDNGSGYHQRTHSFTMYLNASDYIQFNHTRWYSSGNTFDEWNTASVTLIG